MLLRTAYKRHLNTFGIYPNLGFHRDVTDCCPFSTTSLPVLTTLHGTCHYSSPYAFACLPGFFMGPQLFPKISRFGYESPCTPGGGGDESPTPQLSEIGHYLVRTCGVSLNQEELGTKLGRKQMASLKGLVIWKSVESDPRWVQYLVTGCSAG